MEVCKALAKIDRPVKFTEIKESIRDSPEFAVLETSMNKVLSRTLGHLVGAGLVLKFSRATRSGREADVYYFRFFRLMNKREGSCESCTILRKILDLLREELRESST